MDFALSDEQLAIRESVERICARFGDDYWRERDRTGTFPTAFRDALAEGGWLGVAMPEAYGGAGLGITEAAVLMHAVARSAGAMSAASAVHINIFGPHPIVVHGSEEQRSRWLPDLIAGRVGVCFGVTEPDAGLDTGSISTRAERAANGYVVHGKKLWTSTAQTAHKILLLARTTPLDRVSRRTEGLSLFFTDLDRRYVTVREIDKMGRAAVDSNEVFIDGLPVPLEDRIGEEGKGFEYLLHGLNPERVLVGAEAVGIGQRAVELASRYARERNVFGRPIGQNQAIQHPLAQSWMELEAAWLACMRAAWAYDKGLPCGAEANSAKYLSAEAAYRACERAVMTHGGMGYAKEFDVERLWREVLITRIAPVSPQLILCYIAERVLGLPRSY
ncbi:MAG: acyl-CoA dehydrogenase family protein [Gammaproteobacteria bacterium]|nr:acyl-CoA dehydrogenase family protein [Gammaproteobacteria bacterium]